MGISGDLIDMADNDNNFLNNIITREETWCFLYDPQKYGHLFNENYHFHLEKKNFESIGVK